MKPMILTVLILGLALGEELFDEINRNETCEENCTETTTLMDELTTVETMVPTTLPTLPPEKSKPKRKSKKEKNYMDEKNCFCDLTAQKCDINCCCDKDCSKLHFELFSTCLQPAESKIDLKYCNTQNFVWKNRTGFKMEMTSNGLFCIVRNNLPERIFHYKDQDLSSYSKIESSMKTQHRWSMEKQRKHEIAIGKYKEGSDIVVIKNGALNSLEIPTKMVTNACLSKVKVKFFKKLETSCLADNIKPETIPVLYSRLVKDSIVIASPELFNTSWLNNLTDCPKNICISINLQLCDHFFVNCLPFGDRNTSTSKPIFPIVYKIKYEIIYNLTIGITKVNLYFAIKNIRTPFTQFYQIDFREENQTIDYSLYRSGNPGYQPGKPILIGELSPLEINQTDFTPKLAVKKRLTDNFLVIPINIEEECGLDDFNHKIVKFGTNMHLECSFTTKLDVKNESNYCEILQNNIWDFWKVKNQTSLKTIYFGIAGNSNRTNLHDWRQVVYDKVPVPSQDLDETVVKCLSVVTKLQINILFARKTSRDLKNNIYILGIYFKFGLGKMSFKTLDKFVKLNLVTEVFHHDLTNYKYDKIEFASAPTFDFHLPNDFFYPFEFNNAVNLNGLNINVFFTVALIKIII